MRDDLTVNMNWDWLGLLQVIFIVLKIVGIVEWSWWWVFSPVWVPIAVVGVILLILFVANWLLERR